MKKILKELSEISAPSGFEQNVVKYLYKRLAKKADKCHVDNIGNLILEFKGSKEGPKLLLSAHSDQVGFVVKKIEKDGLIKFEKIGGHDDRILQSQRVLISTEKGQIAGVIGTLSCHMVKYEDPKMFRPHTSMYIDVGVSSYEEVVNMGICIGDYITYATEFTEFGNNRAFGRGFDDRVGCAILAKLVEEIDFEKVEGTVYVSFSAQEEVGLRGAKVAAYQVDADLSIAVDTTPCGDTPDVAIHQTVAIGKGPAIRVMDGYVISNTPLRNFIKNLAESSNIPYQMEVFTGIGTDAGEIHKDKAGVCSCVVSIPSRYTHSPVEVIDFNDMDFTKELLKKFINQMQCFRNTDTIFN